MNYEWMKVQPSFSLYGKANTWFGVKRPQEHQEAVMTPLQVSKRKTKDRHLVLSNDMQNFSPREGRNIVKETWLLTVILMWTWPNFFGYQTKGWTQSAGEFRSTQITAVKIWLSLLSTS